MNINSSEPGARYPLIITHCSDINITKCNPIHQSLISTVFWLPKTNRLSLLLEYHTVKLLSSQVSYDR